MPVFRAIPPSILTILLLTLPACFQYAPIPGGTPSPGEEVRLRLTPEAVERVSAQAGRNLSVLEGRMLGRTPVGDSLLLAVPFGPGWAGTTLEGRMDTVRVHSSDVEVMDRKEVSRTGSALVGVAVLTVAVALFRSVAGDRNRPNRGGDEEGPPPPEEL